MTEATGTADRMVLLKEGRIEQVGSPTELYQHPETSFIGASIARAGVGKNRSRMA